MAITVLSLNANHKCAFLFACTIMLLAGCSSLDTRPKSCCSFDAQNAYKSSNTYLSEFELNRDDILDTDGPYHSIAAGSSMNEAGELILNSHRLKPMSSPKLSYLIGLEKTKNKHVKFILSPKNEIDSKESMVGRLVLPATTDNNKALVREYKQLLTEQTRALLLTHIAKFKDKHKTCYLTSVYSHENRACSGTFNVNSNYSPELIFSNSWNALSKNGVLYHDMFKELSKGKSPTHIVLMSTGWNTIQSESIDNYNDWIRRIEKSASDSGVEYRPVYVGITWPSTWFFNGGNLFSIFNKGNDADEAGLTWVNMLLNNVLKPIKQDFGAEIVMIGHSYGTRVLGHAASSGHLLPTYSDSDTAVDKYIALQGAHSYRRVFDSEKHGNEGAPFRYMKERVKNIWFTTSRHDKANSKAFWTRYIGRLDPDRLNDRLKKYFTSVNVDKYGSMSDGIIDFPEKIALIDASEIVRCKKPGSGGASHSDVYNNQVGSLLGEIIFDKKTTNLVASNCSE